MKPLSSSQKKKIIQQLEDQFGTIQNQIDEFGASEDEVVGKIKTFANWKN